MRQTSADTTETNFGGPALPKERKVIHFSSGETLVVEDSEEEEEETSNKTPFEEPKQKVGICLKGGTCGEYLAVSSCDCFCLFSSQTLLSFKNVAILVGRFSLLGMPCDIIQKPSDCREGHDFSCLCRLH